MGAYGSPELPLPGQRNELPDWDKNLVYCRKCGFKYNKALKKCPQCGGAHKSKPGCVSGCMGCIWVLVFLAAIFILFVGWLLWWSDTQTSGQNGEPAPSLTQNNTPKISKEEFIASCENVTYKDIARNPNKQVGKNAIFTGKVIQAEYNAWNVTMRVDVTKNEYFDFYDDTMYVEYLRKSSDEDRILEGDIITMYGTVMGLKTYETIFGAQVTIPYLIAEYIDILSE